MNYPKYLNFKTKLHSIDIQWTNPQTLKFQAIQIAEPTQLFRGQFRGEDKKSQNKIEKIFNFINKKRDQAISKNNFSQLYGTISVIDASKESNKGEDYRLRILYQSELMQVNLKAQKVQHNYFLKKQLFFAELQRRNDSLIISELQQKLQLQDRKIDEQNEMIGRQTEQMKQAFRQNIGGLVEAVTGRINQQFQANMRKFNLDKSEKDDTEPDQNMVAKKLIEKLKKSIKKQKKGKKKSKKSKQKKKDRKKKKKQRKLLKKLIEADRKQKSPQNQNNHQLAEPESKNTDHDKNNTIDLDEEAKEVEKIRALDRDIISVDMNGEDGIWEVKDAIRRKLELRHQKNKPLKLNQPDKPRIQPALIKPTTTDIFGMNKLRNRGNQQQIPQNIDLQNSSQVQQYIPKRNDMKNKKIQKDKKQQKKQKKQKHKSEKPIAQQNGLQPNQADYQKKLEEYRKTGDIEAVRLGRINRIKAAMKAPAVLQYDQFNPEYKGEAKYKPFVKLNEFQSLRPGQIFAGRLDEPPAETKRIPAIFRSQIPSCKSYQVNGNVIRKIKGTSYQQMVFDYPIPVTGKHIITMRIVESKRFYIWFGVIDFREKDREESYNKKNCIAFSFKTGHIVTNNKWSRSKIGCLDVGMAVRMQIDMDKSSISWFVSDGRNNIATINKLLKRLVLVPYLEIMDNDDQVCFED